MNTNTSLRLNRHLFTETGTDSGALNVLGTVVHQFPDEGDYVIEVRRDDEFVGSRLLVVSDDYHTVQTTYDLSSLDGAHDDCDCGGTCTCEDEFDCIREDGYAVFHVGSGSGGYSVTVDPVGERRERREFDSGELDVDDTFAAVLLRPGTYTATNEVDGATADITVPYPKGPGSSKNRSPVEIAVTDDGLDPDAAEVHPGQGLRFEIETAARIVVELDEPHEKATEEPSSRTGDRRTPRLDVGSTTRFDPGSLKRSELETRVADITNTTELRALLLAERRGDDRTEVVETIRSRIRDVTDRPG